MIGFIRDGAELQSASILALIGQRGLGTIACKPWRDGERFLVQSVALTAKWRVSSFML